MGFAEGLAIARDLFIVVLALESLVVVGLLIWLILELRGLTRLMKLDLVFFRRVPSGPFFALLVNDGRSGGSSG